jgi:hypothetical protein
VLPGLYPPVDSVVGAVVSWLEGNAGSDATVAAGNSTPAGSVNPPDAGGVVTVAVPVGTAPTGGIAKAVTALVGDVVGGAIEGGTEANCDGAVEIGATGDVAGEVLPGKG